MQKLTLAATVLGIGILSILTTTRHLFSQSAEDGREADTLQQRVGLSLGYTQSDIELYQQTPATVDLDLAGFHPYYAHIPWKGATSANAVLSASSGASIPMFTFSAFVTKDGSTRNVTWAGGSPFS